MLVRWTGPRPTIYGSEPHIDRDGDATPSNQNLSKINVLTLHSNHVLRNRFDLHTDLSSVYVVVGIVYSMARAIFCHCIVQVEATMHMTQLQVVRRILV